MPWLRVRQLIGPGPIWLIPRQKFLDAMVVAEEEGRADVQGHLRIMLETRDAAMQDAPAKRTPD